MDVYPSVFTPTGNYTLIDSHIYSLPCVHQARFVSDSFPFISTTPSSYIQLAMGSHGDKSYLPHARLLCDTSIHHHIITATYKDSTPPPSQRCRETLAVQSALKHAWEVPSWIRCSLGSGLALSARSRRFHTFTNSSHLR